MNLAIMATMSAAALAVVSLDPAEKEFVPTGACRVLGAQAPRLVLFEDALDSDRGSQGFALGIYSCRDLTLLQRIEVSTGRAMHDGLLVDEASDVAYAASRNGDRLYVVQLESGARGVVPVLETGPGSDTRLQVLELVPDVDGDGACEVLMAVQDVGASRSRLVCVGSARRAGLWRTTLTSEIRALATSSGGGYCLIETGRTEQLRPFTIDREGVTWGTPEEAVAGSNGRLAAIDGGAFGRVLAWGRHVITDGVARLRLELRRFEGGERLIATELDVEDASNWVLTGGVFARDRLLVALGFPDHGAGQGRLVLLDGTDMSTVGELYGERLLDHFASGVALLAGADSPVGVSVGNPWSSDGTHYLTRFELSDGALRAVAVVRE